MSARHTQLTLGKWNDKAACTWIGYAQHALFATELPPPIDLPI